MDKHKSAFALAAALLLLISITAAGAADARSGGITTGEEAVRLAQELWQSPYLGVDVSACTWGAAPDEDSFLVSASLAGEEGADLEMTLLRDGTLWALSNYSLLNQRAPEPPEFETVAAEAEQDEAILALLRGFAALAAAGAPRDAEIIAFSSWDPQFAEYEVLLGDAYEFSYYVTVRLGAQPQIAAVMPAWG